jgi:hypothetical protein
MAVSGIAHPKIILKIAPVYRSFSGEKLPFDSLMHAGARSPKSLCSASVRHRSFVIFPLYHLPGIAILKGKLSPELFRITAFLTLSLIRIKLDA